MGMKNALIALVLLLGIVLVGYVLVQNREVADTVDDATYTTFTDRDTGVQFAYKTAPDGYVLDDLTSFSREKVEGTEVAKVYRIMNAREKAELESSEGGREGPPTINVLVFKNLKNQSASMWVDDFGTFSNIGLAVGPVDRDAVVGGAHAVTYRIDGLYQADTVVVAHGGYIYVFSGAFLKEGADIHQDYLKLIDSVEFLPAAPQVKIDPHVACESALAYMTFASGDEAKAFVESCVRGEHPEVIERYVKDMDVDGAAI